MNKKLFTEKQVDISAFLAGPIPPGLLIYHNYKALGKEKQAYITLAATLIFTITFFYILFQLPEEIVDKVPDFVFTAFYGLLVFLFFRNFLADDIEKAIEEGAEKKSNWSVAGFTILGFVINMVIIFGIAIDQPFYEGEVLIIEGNELYYDADQVTEEDANKLIDHFYTVGFFGPDYGNISRLQFINNSYEITMLIDEQVWNDEELITTLTSLKWLIEADLGKPTKLKLESVSLSGTSKFKEI